MAALAKSWRRGKACATRRLAARFRVSPKDLSWGWWQAEEGQLRVAQGRFDLHFLKNDFLFWTAMSLGQSWYCAARLT